MHSQQPPGVVQNWSTLQCSKHDIEQCGYDHAPVTRGRMRTQFPLPHGVAAPLLLGAKATPAQRATQRRPLDRGAWTAKRVKRPRQQPPHPQYANYWAPLTRKRHTMPHSAQPQHKLLGSANAETTPAGGPAAAADRKQRPDTTCEGKNG